MEMESSPSLIHRIRWCLVIVLLLMFSYVEAHIGDVSHAMAKEEREMLKEEARDMFYHAYRAYMVIEDEYDCESKSFSGNRVKSLKGLGINFADCPAPGALSTLHCLSENENAYPADELMPLTCCGRWRGTEPSRGDIDDTLGNFSLTLVDTLDTLVILGDLKEFEQAVRLVARDVSFDSDIVVSVFETNIRILGGLLSGHILAEYLQQRAGIMSWYRSELLDLARDVGYRLLPAFNTTTGIPHARINLRYGLKSQKLESSRETCTACAGTMILEMAALSRLTGESIFEEKAHKAMDVLWRMRHRSSDLMGTVLNVHSGDWVRRDSGVGAGIDSYYEYCLKAYILLGDERYLGRFNRHYSAVMKYISQGPMLLDVHMHRPHTNSRNFMDALLAFWPGLQVLKGDIKPAVETHEMLYQVMQRHNFIPEAFTTDFQVHWGQHPLRPEFLESTYFLYRATGDSYYLEVGRNVLQSLQKYARVPCGYAAVKDVRTGVHEDRMDSFVLAETFKYLYLLFADPNDLILDLDEFLFTTEAHLLPLSLARLSNFTFVDSIGERKERARGTVTDTYSVWDEDVENACSCPNTLHLFPESVRRPLRNMVDGICPKNTVQRKLRASEYQAGNEEHAKIIRDMGITVLSLPDGRVQLLHNLASAQSSSDGEEGILFMQEMVEISRSQSAQPETSPQAVVFHSQWAATQAKQSSKISADGKVVLSAGPAYFGQELKGSKKVIARVGVAEPLRVCGDLENPERMLGRIAIVERGDCMFIEKARRVQAAGAVGVVVVDNTPGTSAASSAMFAMSGDGQDDVSIPVVFLFYSDATILLHALSHTPSMLVTLTSSASPLASPLSGNDLEQKQNHAELSTHDATLQQLKESVHDFLRKKAVPQVGTPEVTPVDAGDMLMMPSPNPRGWGGEEGEGGSRVVGELLKRAVVECEGKMDSVVGATQHLLRKVSGAGAWREAKPPLVTSDVLLCLTAIENVALMAAKEKPSLLPPSELLHTLAATRSGRLEDREGDPGECPIPGGEGALQRKGGAKEEGRVLVEAVVGEGRTCDSVSGDKTRDEL